MQFHPGTRISNYEIRQLLGKGGMGEVYVAVDSRLEREVALKFVLNEHTTDDTFRRRFLREAKAASRLVHPGVAVVYEVDEWQGNLFLAMEFVRGITLTEHLRRGALPFSETCDYAVQLAEILRAAHEQGVVHRDLKPGNIIVTPEGRLKLLDFGLAILDAASPDDGTSPTQSALTVPGGVMGTPAYLSPERVRGSAADARADLFAYGIILFEMAAGRHPFGSSNVMTTVANILHTEVEPLPGVPPRFDAVVRRCLEKDLEARYQSAAQILDDLQVPKPEPQVFRPRHMDRVRASLTRRPVLLSGATAMAAAAWYGWRTWGRSVPVDSLAVLPVSTTGAEEYLADALTESLIALLAQAPGVRVLARSAVYNPQVAKLDPIAAGKKLGVQAVLTATVRATPQAYVVIAELVETATARHLWGRSFEVVRELVASIQGEIAGPVLALLGGGQFADTARKSGSVPAAAYQACMTGRFHLNKRTREGIDKSVGYFREALASKPDYALAWAGLAGAYSATGKPSEVSAKALAAAQKSVDSDSNLPEAHSALAWIRMAFNWDWSGAEQEFQTAIRLNPSYQYARANYGNLLVCRGRFDEAVAQVHKAATLDPLSVNVSVTLGSIYYLARRNDQAIQQLSNVLQAEKRSPLASFYRGTALIQAGRYDEAIRDFQTGLAVATDMGAVADLGLAYGRAGQAAKAREQIAKIEQVRAQRYVAPYYLAIPCIGLGDTERAIDLLEESAEDRAFPVIYMGVEPKLDPLRNHPRFQRLIKLVGV